MFNVILKFVASSYYSIIFFGVSFHDGDLTSLAINVFAARSVVAFTIGRIDVVYFTNATLEKKFKIPGGFFPVLILVTLFQQLLISNTNIAFVLLLSTVILVFDLYLAYLRGKYGFEMTVKVHLLAMLTKSIVLVAVIVGTPVNVFGAVIISEFSGLMFAFVYTGTSFSFNVKMQGFTVFNVVNAARIFCYVSMLSAVEILAGSQSISLIIVLLSQLQSMQAIIAQKYWNDLLKFDADFVKSYFKVTAIMTCIMFVMILVLYMWPSFTFLSSEIYPFLFLFVIIPLTGPKLFVLKNINDIMTTRIELFLLSVSVFFSIYGVASAAVIPLVLIHLIGGVRCFYLAK